MSTKPILRIAFSFLAVLPLMAGGPVAAAEKKLGWADSAELSYVITSGNTETKTFSFKNKLTRTWTNALFQLNAGGLAAENTKRFRAVDTSGNELEADVTETTARNYHLNGRYDRDITPRFFWNAGASWERNTFAGFDDRYIASAGFGNKWFDADELSWRTTYSATYTDQEDVFPVPGIEDTFLGARFTSDFKIKFGKTSSYENNLVADLNLDETDDWRADWLHSVSVSMTSNLALKVSLQLVYDNLPSQELVDVVTGPFPPGTPTGNTAFVELDDLDTTFTTSLVINF